MSIKFGLLFAAVALSSLSAVACTPATSNMSRSTQSSLLATPEHVTAVASSGYLNGDNSSVTDDVSTVHSVPVPDDAKLGAKYNGGKHKF